VRYVTGKTSGGTCPSGRAHRLRDHWPTSPRGRAAGTATPLIDLAVLALRIHNRQVRS
jgi:hypothetical protein